MTKVLRIDASSRLQDSHSRQMADVFQEKWLKAKPKDEFTVRDLVKEPIPHIENMTIAGFYTPEDKLDDPMKKATALSDRLIKELLSADVILLSTPMYNFSVPSALKAYIDQIVRIGQTFGFEESKGFFGLVEGKKAYIITAYGAVYKGPFEAYNFLAPYLTAVFGLIGISDVEYIDLEGTSIDPSAFEASKKAAIEKIDRITSS